MNNSLKPVPRTREATAALNDATQIKYFDDFDGPNEWAFLSNFYKGEPLELNGRSYATGEHLFAAFKASNLADHMLILEAEGPDEAKAIGRTIRLRKDWEQVKFDTMVMVVALKFAPGRVEGETVLATGDRVLVEGTFWGDEVWGVNLKVEGHPGRNWLGRLLMARRAELLAYAEYGARLPSLDATIEAARGLR